jgi:hypothetical protein
MSARLFLSYAHEDSESAARIAEELLARGIRVWQDIDDIRLGKRIESEMEDGIANCDGIVHLLTPAAIASPAVRREVEFAIRRRRREPDFRVFAVARDIGEGHEEVGELTLAQFGENFARDWLELLAASEEPVDHEEAASFTRKVLRSLLPRGKGPDDGTWHIGLHTRSLAAGMADLDLDWRPLLGSDARRPGDYESWGRAWRAVRDVRDVLCEHSARRQIFLEAAAHQTAAMLFGLAFSANARFRLAVVDQEGKEWRREAPAQLDGFTINRQPEDLEGTYLTIEIEVARQILPAVAEHIAATGEEPRARLLATPTDSVDWIEPRAGAQLARALATAAKEAIDDLSLRRVEVYTAAPIPLAVLFATELGALHAEIAIFEFHEDGYRPSIAIPEEER